MFSWLADLGQFLIDLLMYVPKMLFSAIMSALASLITAIPVPEWIASAGSAFGSISSGVMYWCGWMQLDYGISIVVGAYLLRFLIRRIPFIG
jgi:hypothetical protein